MPSKPASPLRVRLALGWAVVLGAAVSIAALAQATFLPGGDLDLVVSGTVDAAARVYESQAEAAVLVVSERLPSPILLHVRSRGVQAVPAARLREVGGGLAIERGDALEQLGTFELEGAEVRFSHGAVGAVLRPKPALVGEHALDALYRHTPKYRADAAVYSPDPAVIARLREVGAEYHVKIVFGSWCSVCKQYLPRGLAVDDALDDAGIRFEYVGLPLEDPWHTPEVERLEVKTLPTAIVYRDGREIGRFAGAQEWDQPEARIWEAISRAGR
ncbi:MAG TPA: thioredoxin family protein [Thermoanaerobaculia bacterium]|nr:thioredoxin family protein [Thermoanaerobaculia bacterium]